eukprot:3467223-Rhodomonas_salina.1
MESQAVPQEVSTAVHVPTVPSPAFHTHTPHHLTSLYQSLLFPPLLSPHAHLTISPHYITIYPPHCITIYPSHYIRACCPPTHLTLGPTSLDHLTISLCSPHSPIRPRVSTGLHITLLTISGPTLPRPTSL